LTPYHHGESQKEASTEDEQAQAPKALEGESPQKAYVAEVSGAAGSRLLWTLQTRRDSAAGFSFYKNVGCLPPRARWYL